MTNHEIQGYERLKVDMNKESKGRGGAKTRRKKK